MPTKQILIDFSDMSGGKNSAFPRHALSANQVSDTINAIHESVGVSRAPGFKGINETALFGAPLRGMFNYIHDDGTETLLAIAGQKLYTINAATGEATEIGAGSITADTECFGVNAAGKFWIVNGTNFIKVEDNLAVYRVGIATPTGTSAAAKAGGSLPAGVYGCYVTYSRKNGAGQYLHSLPYSLGNVTLSAGNLTVTLTVPNSSDAQVTNKVVWLTDAGGAIPYYYGETNNATTSFDITSNASRNSLLLMSTQAAANAVLPITPSAIFATDDRLIVWDANDRTLYWSLKTDTNPFELERFLPENFRITSLPVNAIFTVNEDLYLNHLGHGIGKLPSGDLTSVIKLVYRGIWFKDATTCDGKSNVVYHKGIAWGITNDGFRWFDGNVFSDDLTFHIKPDMDIFYSGISAAFIPSLVVNRRLGKRTEVRVSFRSLAAGSTMNNTQYVFNLDYYFDPMNQKKTWEIWENGFSHMAIHGGAFIGGQSISTGAQIARENGVSDLNCYSFAGVFVSGMKIKQIYILTRTMLDQLDAVTIWGAVYAFATSAGTINGALIRFDAQNTKEEFTIQGSTTGYGAMPSGGSLPLPFYLSPQYPVQSTRPMTYDSRGNSVAIEIMQTENDDNFFLYKLQLPKAVQVINNLT